MFFLCSKIKQIFNFSKRLYKLRSKLFRRVKIGLKTACFYSIVQFESCFPDTPPDHDEFKLSPLINKSIDIEIFILQSCFNIHIQPFFINTRHSVVLNDLECLL